MCSMLVQHPGLHLTYRLFSFLKQSFTLISSSVQGFKETNLRLGGFCSAPSSLQLLHFDWHRAVHATGQAENFLQEICMKTRLCAVRHKHKAQRWWQAVASCVLMWALCSRSVKIQTWERSYYVSCPHSGHRLCAYPLLTFWSNLIIDPWIPNTPLNNIVLLEKAKAKPER